MKSLGANVSPIDSLAVLPFVNVGADPNTEYLSEGMTTRLIASLSQLPSLKVRSRSVFQDNSDGADAQAVGTELGVRAVLTGRVVRQGDSLLIMTELLDVRDHRPLWSKRYTGRPSDVLAM